MIISHFSFQLNATNPPFDKLINQLMITLSQVNDPIKIIEAIPFFENLQRFEQSIENGINLV